MAPRNECMQRAQRMSRRRSNKEGRRRGMHAFSDVVWLTFTYAMLVLAAFAGLVTWFFRKFNDGEHL